MEFLSETARKEKRSLLGTGSAGILVAWIGIDQTTIELAPLKLSNPILPKVIVWSLLLTIAYLLFKFCFSYFYEQFRSELKSLAVQIREGRTVMDINREEQEVIEASRNLREQQKTYQATYEKEKGKLVELQATIDRQDVAQEAALKAHDEEQSQLEKALTDGPKGHSGPFEVFHVPSLGLTMDRAQLEQRIELKNKLRAEFVRNRAKARQKEFDDLEYETQRFVMNEKGRTEELQKNEESVKSRRESVAKWRLAHRGATLVTPLHLILEVLLPIIVGLVSLVSLAWLAFHLPTPTPISFPPV